MTQITDGIAISLTAQRASEGHDSICIFQDSKFQNRGHNVFTLFSY
jgi:hypothetical protein